MLVISRRPGESLLFGDNLTIHILEVSGDKVKIGIDAPRSVRIIRTEVLETENSNRDAVISAGTANIGSLAEVFSITGKPSEQKKGVSE